MRRFTFISTWFLVSLGNLYANDSMRVSKAFFTVDSSHLPIFCFNKVYDPSFSYRWGFYLSSNIASSKKEFKESVASFSTLNGIEKCIDFRDSQGVYWVCLESRDIYYHRDTFCQRINSQFKLVTPPRRVFVPSLDSSTGQLRQYSFFKTDNFTAYHLLIYNRWGEKVFESDQPNFNWNGLLKNTGAECPNGTYYILIQYTLFGETEKKKFNSTLTLIR